MVMHSGDMEVRFAEQLKGGEGTVLMKALAKVLPVNVRLLSELTLQRGDGIGTHDHRGESEIYVITEGQALYSDDGEQVLLGKGDTAICPSGHSHAIANAGEGDLKFIAVIVLE